MLFESLSGLRGARRSPWPRRAAPRPSRRGAPPAAAPPPRPRPRPSPRRSPRSDLKSFKSNSKEKASIKHYLHILVYDIILCYCILYCMHHYLMCSLAKARNSDDVKGLRTSRAQAPAHELPAPHGASFESSELAPHALSHHSHYYYSYYSYYSCYTYICILLFFAC